MNSTWCRTETGDFAVIVFVKCFTDQVLCNYDKYFSGYFIIFCLCC